MFSGILQPRGRERSDLSYKREFGGVETYARSFGLVDPSDQMKYLIRKRN
jgi:hypothetical protein